MKINDDYVLRTVMGTPVLIPTREAAYSSPSMITLNELGAFIVEHLADADDDEAMIGLVLAEYDVTREVAAADTTAFLSELRGLGIIIA